jgi:hypothetical protein
MTIYVGQYPFASKITNDYPECYMCTWVWRSTDNRFHLKLFNAWCPDHVSYGKVF